MKLQTLALPSVAAGLAALLLAPGPADGFALLGGELRLTKRDVRVFDNFTDPTAHTNTTFHRSFPGFTGPALAVWKAAAEWGSILHGDGTGKFVEAQVLPTTGLPWRHEVADRLVFSQTLGDPSHA